MKISVTEIKFCMNQIVKLMEAL